MKFFSIGFVFLFLLTGCSWWRERQAESKAKEIILSELRDQVGEQLDKTLGRDFSRRNDFVEFVLGRTTFETEKVTEDSAEGYSITLRIHFVSDGAREKLMGIVQPLVPPKLNAFNFTDAIGMLKDKGISIESVSIRTVKIPRH